MHKNIAAAIEALKQSAIYAYRAAFWENLHSTRDVISEVIIYHPFAPLIFTTNRSRLCSFLNFILPLTISAYAHATTYTSSI